MSIETEKLENLKKRVAETYSEVPFLVKNNPMVIKTHNLLIEVIDSMLSQQQQIDALKDEQFSRGDL